MPTIQTYEILAEGVTAHLVKVLARAFGVTETTVRAWRQPKESDEHPTGTGKGNPIDQAARLIRLVHQYNPGNARQAAQYFGELVDELDRASGLFFVTSETPVTILQELREVVRDEAELATELIGSKFDEHSLRRARREIADERSALERLDATVAAELEKQERRA